MFKLIIFVIICFLLSANAFAGISVGNQRLDHALDPNHPAKLVIFGQIKEIKGEIYSDRELSFEVEDVIFGNSSFAHKIITVSTASFDWNTELVPHLIGTRCIIILGKLFDKDYLHAVVPATGKKTEVAKNHVETLKILELEILKVLQSEKSGKRQREILLQLAPILRRENMLPISSLSKSKDPWVKRAALTALIYATEDDEYIKLAAADIKNFFADETVKECLKKQKQLSKHCLPAEKFKENYFFLESKTWRWGSRWNEEEAAKHLRIWNSFIATEQLSDESLKFFGH